MSQGSESVNPQHQRAALLAKLFDLRMFIGSLFCVFGIIVTIRGLLASPEEIAKGAGINLSLWTGLFMLVLGIVFVGWTLLSPPQVYEHHDFTEEDLPEQLRGLGLEHE